MGDSPMLRVRRMVQAMASTRSAVPVSSVALAEMVSDLLLVIADLERRIKALEDGQ